MSTAPPSATVKRRMPASEMSACSEIMLIQVSAIAMIARSWPSFDERPARSVRMPPITPATSGT